MPAAICEIAGGHFLRLRAIALALRGPPLQWPFSIRERAARQPQADAPGEGRKSIRILRPSPYRARASRSLGFALSGSRFAPSPRGRGAKSTSAFGCRKAAMEGRFRHHRAQLSLRVLRFEFRVRFLLSSSSGSSCPPPENFSDRILWSEAGERFHRHLAQFFPRALRCVVLARL